MPLVYVCVLHVPLIFSTRTRSLLLPSGSKTSSLWDLSGEDEAEDFGVVPAFPACLEAAGSLNYIPGELLGMLA